LHSNHAVDFRVFAPPLGYTWSVRQGWMLIVVVWFCESCAAANQARHRADPATSELMGEGLASYYGAAFDGRPTASGEAFDHRALTAAHRTLPFGSCLGVLNLANGRQVRVRVNDRGPFVRGRIIDLSEAAARRLGFVDAGVTRVLLRRCGE
jgi:rare lipoprotein A